MGEPISIYQFYQKRFGIGGINFNPDMELIDIQPINGRCVALACRNINTGNVYGAVGLHSTTREERWRVMFISVKHRTPEVAPLRMLARFAPTNNSYEQRWRDECLMNLRKKSFRTQVKMGDVLYNTIEKREVWAFDTRKYILASMVANLLSGRYVVMRRGEVIQVKLPSCEFQELKEFKGALFDMAPVADWGTAVGGKRFEHLLHYLKTNNMLTEEVIHSKVGGRYIVYNLGGKYTLSDMTDGKKYTHYVLNDNGLKFLRRLFIQHKLLK